MSVLSIMLLLVLPSIIIAAITGCMVMGKKDIIPIDVFMTALKVSAVMFLFELLLDFIIMGRPAVWLLLVLNTMFIPFMGVWASILDRYLKSIDNIDTPVA